MLPAARADSHDPLPQPTVDTGGLTNAFAGRTCSICQCLAAWLGERADEIDGDVLLTTQQAAALAGVRRSRHPRQTVRDRL
jgi:hypothetical protein